MENQQFDLGMIGLGVMGRNLLLNMADHGFKVIAFNRSQEKLDNLKAAATAGTVVDGITSMEGLVQKLKVPRRILLLVPAGKPVDEVIETLIPLLQEGDIVIDGGNSHYTDTLRRNTYLREKGLHFMGMGVSGGEEGARTGPSIMPGGEEEAYTSLKPLLEAVAAKVNGVPCVAYLGKHAAGHYVKMVHNGIEYGIMQMISECYDMLKNGIGLNNDELSATFDKWDKTDMTSYLVEITAAVLAFNDKKTNNRLVDMILDKAGSKGTGKWTSQDALDLPSPIPTIDMAVTLRNISSFKEERVAASKIYAASDKKLSVDKEAFIQQVHDALFFATLMSYVQGLAMLQKASKELSMDIPMQQVVKVWRGGCIIRSSLLDVFIAVFEKDPLLPNLLLENSIAELLKAKEQNLREVIVQAVTHGFPSGSLIASLSYFDAYKSANLPTNLIQAQRDYFGAHTYQRIDDPTGLFYHTEWMHPEL